MNRRCFLKSVGLGFVAMSGVGVFNLFSQGKQSRPNILFIFIDDMGYADPSCYGDSTFQTPNMDRLAREGIRFTQFYVNSPVCSPSRVAMTTGQYPARWRIYSYLDSHEANQRRHMADFLDPKAPSLARQLKAAGYHTAHFGKWHMGGGRDVDNAPHPQVFGFDESSVTFEGLGDRLLINNDGLSNQSARLGQGRITWVDKHQITQIRVDQTLDFIRRHKGSPFYVNLWFNDVHDPHLPDSIRLEKYKTLSDNPYEQKFYAVLDEMDRQIGRVLDGLAEMGVDNNTLIILTSDNGPTDWPHYYKEGYFPPGRTGPLRGRKWSLYEGGIRMPFIVRWTGRIPAGKVDPTSVGCGVDLFPTFCKLVGATLPEGVSFDGQDISGSILGTPTERKEPIYWYYPNQPKPGKQENISPTLAIRDGRWKLLANPDGTQAQLYDLESDVGEQQNRILEQPETAKHLWDKLTSWSDSIGIKMEVRGLTIQ
jgi:arylsulfatase A-like enzyme